MKVALIILVVFLLIAAYLVTGFYIAKLRLAWMWDHARHQYTHESSLKSSVRAQFIGTTIAWPVYVPFTFVLQVCQTSVVRDTFDALIAEPDPRNQ